MSKPKVEYVKGDMVKRTKSAQLGEILEKAGWKKNSGYTVEKAVENLKPKKKKDE